MNTRHRLPIRIVTKGLKFAEYNGDDLDNQYWKWCADDPMADTATFDMFDLGPDFILPAETQVTIEHIWAYTKEGRVGMAMNYCLKTTRPLPVREAVALMLTQYHADADAAGGEGRFYYIEQVAQDSAGNVTIATGT